MAPFVALQAMADPGKAADMLAYHKVPRSYLGVANPDLDLLVKGWRAERDPAGWVTLAQELWATDVHEARVAAAKLLTRPRIRPDDAVWALIVSWVPTFDAWAVADHASIAGQHRLVAEPSRLDQVETWTQSPSMWTRRAALVMTLPWTKRSAPDHAASRERILGWCASYADDKEWFIQKAIAWWVRDLSKHHPEQATAFLAEVGPRLKPFARKEAAKHLGLGS